MSSSEATLTLISWLSKLFFAMGLPSLGFSGPGRSVAAGAPADPSWQKVAGKLGWTWLWDWEDGLGLKASSALGSSFRWNGDLSVSLWLAAADRRKRSWRTEKKQAENLKWAGKQRPNTVCDQTSEVCWVMWRSHGDCILSQQLRVKRYLKPACNQGSHIAFWIPQRWDQVTVLQVTSKSQVFALKSSPKSWVKAKLKTEIFSSFWSRTVIFTKCNVILAI